MIRPKLPWVPKSWRAGENLPGRHVIGLYALIAVAGLAYGILLAPKLPDWVTLAIVTVLFGVMVRSLWVALEISEGHPRS